MTPARTPSRQRGRRSDSGTFAVTVLSSLVTLVAAYDLFLLAIGLR